MLVFDSYCYLLNTCENKTNKSGSCIHPVERLKYVHTAALFATGEQCSLLIAGVPHCARASTTLKITPLGEESISRPRNTYWALSSARYCTVCNEFTAFFVIQHIRSLHILACTRTFRAALSTASTRTPRKQRSPKGRLQPHPPIRPCSLWNRNKSESCQL